MAVLTSRLPPGCGIDLRNEVLYNQYQVELLRARRLRICPRCAMVAPCDKYARFTCPRCGMFCPTQLEARKAFHRLNAVAARRSGKTKVGAMAAREECVVPNALGWVIGPTYKILHDSTMPAFFGAIPPDWVDDWMSMDKDLRLINGHVVAFRSLDDPGRGIGAGPWWAWVDEAQKLKERAWDIFRPSLTDHLGNCIFTWTPNGYDWCWRRLFRPSTEGKHHISGYWSIRFRTVDNPWIRKYAMHEVAEARQSMPAKMFAQEYEADFVSFAGNIYDWDTIEPQILSDHDMQSFIPEWPKIDPKRTEQFLVGLGPGATSLFGGVMIVPTERGLVLVDDYLEDHRSYGYHYSQIRQKFCVAPSLYTNRPLTATWSCDEDKKAVFAELGQLSVGVAPTEHYLMTGIQRVYNWLYAQRLFVAARCERTLDHLREYRWNDLAEDDDEPDETERDYRRNNELPKALASALLCYPTLPPAPAPLSAREQALDPKVLSDIRELRAALDKTDSADDDMDGEFPAFSKRDPHDGLGDFYRD